jgi:hypothetical protein
MGNTLLTYLWRGELWIAVSAVAVFLTVTWVLRGAPPGLSAAAEEDAEAPRAGYRDRIIAAVVVGLMLIMLGAYCALARGILWSLPFFAMGFGLVLYLIAHYRRFRHASPILRRTIDFSTAFLNASLLAGILIVANVIAFRYGGRPIDMTREGTYSLSSLTQKQLTSLDRPVTFTMIFGDGLRARRQHDRLQQLLETYKAVNPDLIHLVSLNRFNDPARLDELEKRVPDLKLLYGVGTVQPGAVVIEYGSGEGAQSVVVRNGDLFAPIPLDPAHGGLDHYASAFTGEDEITSALIRMREGKRSKVGFTTGHGEPVTSDMNPQGRGIGTWKLRFNKVGCDVVDLNLVHEEIPGDLSLLVVVGPKSPFKPDEISKLRGYAARGGPLLLLLSNTEPSGLDEFLKSFNVALDQGLVIDPRYNYNRNASMVYARTEPILKHAIVEPLGPNRGVLLPGAAPIKLLGSPAPGKAPSDPVDPSLIAVPILRSTDYSWAESDPRSSPVRRDDRDKPGPVSVGVAVAERAPTPGDAGGAAQGKPRLVLFSCPAMAENIFHEIERTNLDFLMNAASWLRQRPNTQGIGAATHTALTLSVDPYLRSRLILVPSLVAVMAIVAMGIIVYSARRE